MDQEEEKMGDELPKNEALAAKKQKIEETSNPQLFEWKILPDPAKSESTKARLGQFSFKSSKNDKNRIVKTPAFVIPSIRCTIPNITQDIFAKLLTHFYQSQSEADAQEINFLELNIFDALEMASPKHINNSKKHSLHEFLQFHEHNVAFIMNIFKDMSFDSRLKLFADTGVFGANTSGQFKLDPAKFMENIKNPAFSPELFIPLHDFGTTHNVSSQKSEKTEEDLAISSKQIAKSIQRTENWLNFSKDSANCVPNLSCLNILLSNPSENSCEKSKNWKKTTLDAFLKSVSPKLSNFQGFHYGDFSIIPENQRIPLIAALESKILSSKSDYFKIVSGFGDPFSILNAIDNCGFDVFMGMDYPFICATYGYALTFPTDFSDSDQQFELKIELRENKFEFDTIEDLGYPEIGICYSRGYLHHLLNAHEMLAEVALSVHNLAKYLKFFAKIRETIGNGTFKQFKKRFFEKVK